MRKFVQNIFMWKPKVIASNLNTVLSSAKFPALNSTQMVYYWSNLAELSFLSVQGGKFEFIKLLSVRSDL